jgi:hypothetical protein
VSTITEDTLLENESIVLNERILQLENELQLVKKTLKLQSEDLGRKNRKLSELRYDRDFFIQNDKRTKHITGLSSWATLDNLFSCVEESIKPGKKLSKFQSFILFLMKLRSGATDRDMGYRFGISNVTAARIFHHILGVLYEMLDSLVYWPSREELQKATPSCFRKEFGTSVSIILDCFEIFAESPSPLKAKGEMYSSYKSHSTAKVLIGKIISYFYFFNS